MEIKVLCHSSIKFIDKKIIYFDPYKIDQEYKDADYIFISHDHHDHYSVEDINKVANNKTVIIVTRSLEKTVRELKIPALVVDCNREYILEDNIYFETIRAYTIGRDFHPFRNNWVGYNVTIDNVKYYVAGDSDNTPDNQKVTCDVALLPIGGKYTMDYKEAADLTNIIKPKKVIPTH